jgi:hypothetical protein
MAGSWELAATDGRAEGDAKIRRAELDMIRKDQWTAIGFGLNQPHVIAVVRVQIGDDVVDEVFNVPKCALPRTNYRRHYRQTSK